LRHGCCFVRQSGKKKGRKEKRKSVALYEKEKKVTLEFLHQSGVEKCRA
jgi:hypothetical protein